MLTAVTTGSLREAEQMTEKCVYFSSLPPPPPLKYTHFSVICSRSEEHTSELQSQSNLVCRLLLEKKKHNTKTLPYPPPSPPITNTATLHIVAQLGANSSAPRKLAPPSRISSSAVPSPYQPSQRTN